MVAGEADDVRARGQQRSHILGLAAEDHIVRVQIGLAPVHERHLVADGRDVGARQFRPDLIRRPSVPPLIHARRGEAHHGRHARHGHGRHLLQVAVGGRQRGHERCQRLGILRAGRLRSGQSRHQRICVDVEDIVPRQRVGPVHIEDRKLRRELVERQDRQIRGSVVQCGGDLFHRVEGDGRRVLHRPKDRLQRRHGLRQDRQHRIATILALPSALHLRPRNGRRGRIEAVDHREDLLEHEIPLRGRLCAIADHHIHLGAVRGARQRNDACAGGRQRIRQRRRQRICCAGANRRRGRGGWGRRGPLRGRRSRIRTCVRALRCRGQLLHRTRGRRPAKRGQLRDRAHAEEHARADHQRAGEHTKLMQQFIRDHGASRSLATPDAPRKQRQPNPAQEGIRKCNRSIIDAPHGRLQPAARDEARPTIGYCWRLSIPLYCSRSSAKVSPQKPHRKMQGTLCRRVCRQHPTASRRGGLGPTDRGSGCTHVNVAVF